ncbi:hypothetical protein ARMGADRAFT_1079805 [Armillaria gallica]|uniref:Uncharacterized protein n=1 Tax=Armillaria gallica TaxID=47427 RepID=A0A2H3DWM8_ARMGA|nr:hypothetical protein ARMGADRAFT_1079805 [Armillaria gallica]
MAPGGQYQGHVQPTKDEAEGGLLASDGVGSEWESFDCEMKDLTPTEPTLTVDLKLLVISAVSSTGSSPVPSRSFSPLFENVQPHTNGDESSSDKTEYETSESSPPSTNDSTPSYSSEDSDAYSPLSLEELTCSSLKSKAYVVEPHDNEGWMIQEPTPYVPEPSLLFPYDNLDLEFIFQVMESFQGPCDNSLLQNSTSNELINPFSASYDTVRGLDKYQMSKIALKIHDLMMDLDVYLDQ